VEKREKEEERRARGKGEGCYTAGTAFVVRDGAMRCDGWAVLSTCITATTIIKKKKNRVGQALDRVELKAADADADAKPETSIMSYHSSDFWAAERPWRQR